LRTFFLPLRVISVEATRIGSRNRDFFFMAEQRRIIMNHRIRNMLLRTGLPVLVGVFGLLQQAKASRCSIAAAAGKWDYTYTGTVLTSSGPLPVAAVGHYIVDSAGHLAGSQVRSVSGDSGTEDISGSATVNRDCTATATIAVFLNGELQRTAVLAVTYDSNMNHARGIFQSLTLPDGTNVPVVITSDNSRMFTRE
jgi:hypothetical protein